jgi:hypothetical protein
MSFDLLPNDDSLIRRQLKRDAAGALVELLLKPTFLVLNTGGASRYGGARRHAAESRASIPYRSVRDSVVRFTTTK